MKKYIFGAVLSLGLLISPALTQASGLTTVQINAIISLLQSFGADATTVANVSASLNGTASVPSIIPKSWCHTFSIDLKFGDNDPTPVEPGEIGSLQIALVKESIASASNEHNNSLSGNFGPGTTSAVKAFQKRYGITQTGTVGPRTRAKLNSFYGCNNNVPTAPAQPHIDSVTPVSVSVGSTIAISGSHFDWVPPTPCEGNGCAGRSSQPFSVILKNANNQSQVLWLGNRDASDSIAITIPSGQPCVFANGIGGCSLGAYVITPGQYSLNISVDGRGTSNSLPLTIVSQ